MKNQSEVETGSINGAFIQVLQNQRRGEVLNDAADAIREVVEAVQLVGKPGWVNIRLNIKPASGAESALVVTDAVTCKCPEADKTASIFYAGENGDLLREDPNQKTLPLREVPKAEAVPLREAPAVGKMAAAGDR